MSLGAIPALLASMQIAGSDPAVATDSHAYLSRCEAAGLAMSVSLVRLEADRGIDMGNMKTHTANFIAGIERLRLQAARREDLAEDRVSADRSVGLAAVTDVPLADILAIMDGCEAAHEVMD